MDFSLLYTFHLQLRWVRLHQITANFLIITIYGIRDRSHEQTNKIFELSLKNGVRLIYNITRSYSLLPHSHFGNTLLWSKLWMNEWKKSLSSGMIKNESYFMRTHNNLCQQSVTCPCYIPLHKLNKLNWAKTGFDIVFLIFLIHEQIMLNIYKYLLW